MRKATGRQLWAALGTALLIGAFIALVSVALQNHALPRAWETHPAGSDAITNLQGLFPQLAGSALVAGIVGFVALAAGRPRTRHHVTQPSRSWAKFWRLTALAVVVFAAVWLPWWSFWMSSVPMTAPNIALSTLISATAVQLTLWWWIRRQTGQDQGAWSAALAIQFIALIMAFHIFLIAVLFFTENHNNTGWLIWLMALPHPLLLLLGAQMATRILGADPTDANDDEQLGPASKIQRTATVASIVLIAAATIWAAWPRYMPGQIERSTEEQHPAPEIGQPSDSPGPTADASRSTPTPALDPTQAAPPCEASTLDVTIGGWDAATGARAAGIVVTNNDAHACQLRGIPNLRITQNDQDLEVNIIERELSTDAEETYETITIGPAQSVQAIVYWRGERSAYHDDSSQRVEVLINDEWTPVAFDFHEHMQPMDSPFDVIHGSELEIGPWAMH